MLRQSLHSKCIALLWLMKYQSNLNVIHMYNNMPTLSSKSFKPSAWITQNATQLLKVSFFLTKIIYFLLKPVQTLEQEKGFVQLLTFSKNEWSCSLVLLSCCLPRCGLRRHWGLSVCLWFLCWLHLWQTSPREAPGTRLILHEVCAASSFSDSWNCKILL